MQGAEEEATEEDGQTQTPPAEPEAAPGEGGKAGLVETAREHLLADAGVDPDKDDDTEDGLRSDGLLVTPNVLLPAGRYVVVDPDPSTWSQNSRSGGAGMSRADGVRQ